MSARLRPAGRSDRGSIAVELVGYAFAVTLAVVLAVQGIFIAQAAAVAQQAARDGARAPALGRSVSAEVADQIPDWLTLTDVQVASTADTVRVEVQVAVPFVLPGVTSSLVNVTRDATMPRT